MTITPSEVFFQVRRIKGLYQDIVARDAGLSRMTLISIEKGRRPTSKQAAAIAFALGIPKWDDPNIISLLIKLKEVLQVDELLQVE